MNLCKPQRKGGGKEFSLREFATFPLLFRTCLLSDSTQPKCSPMASSDPFSKCIQGEQFGYYARVLMYRKGGESLLGNGSQMLLLAMFAASRGEKTYRCTVEWLFCKLSASFYYKVQTTLSYILNVVVRCGVGGIEPWTHRTGELEEILRVIKPSSLPVQNIHSY